MDTVVESSETSASDVSAIKEASQELLVDLVQSLEGLTPAATPTAAAPPTYWQGVTDYSTLEEGVAVNGGSGEPDGSLYMDRDGSFPSSLFGSSVPDASAAVAAASSHVSSNEVMYSEMDASVSAAVSLDASVGEHEHKKPEGGWNGTWHSTSHSRKSVDATLALERPQTQARARHGRASVPARTKSQYSLQTAETGIRLLEIAVRSPLAQVVSKSGKAVRKRELNTLLSFQRQHPNTGITRLQLESPLIEPGSLPSSTLKAGSFSRENRSVSSTPVDSASRFKPPSIASMLQLDEHEVDGYLFHPANAAEIDLIDKTLKVLDYAKEPLQSSARKTRTTTNLSTTLSKREATFEVVDAPGEIQSLAANPSRDSSSKPGTAVSGLSQAELQRRIAEDRKAEQKEKLAEVQAAETEWEQHLASTVLKVFHSDLSRRTLGEPEEASKFYFQPSMTGSVDPMGRRVLPPKLPSVTMKQAVAKDATVRRLSQNAQGVLPKIASPTRSGVTTGTRTSPREAELTVLDADRDDGAEDDGDGEHGDDMATAKDTVAWSTREHTSSREQNRDVWCRPPKPPRDRHGKLVHTTAGGAGNSSGTAKLREGPWPIWFMLDEGMLTAKSVWCGVAAIAAVDGLGIANPALSLSTVDEASVVGYCSHVMCATLARLEADLQYEEFVGVIERVLRPRIDRESRSDLDALQWRQFIVAITLLATRACTQQRYPLALSLIRKAEHCVQSDLDMTSATRKELDAYISDAHAYYLAHRGRYSSALDCARKASKLHRALGQYDQLAKSRLHTAAVLSRMRRHKEALRYIDQIMQMVEDGVLEGGGATSAKLTLIAVAYHNKAVDLLLSGQPQDACVAMQAVQRLQKLCAGSCGNFKEDFDWTQYSVLRALTTTPEVKALMRGMSPGAVLQKLAEDLFSE